MRSPNGRGNRHRSILLLIAYIQRCGEFYNPVHWLIPGLVLFTAGLVGHARADAR